MKLFGPHLPGLSIILFPPPNIAKMSCILKVPAHTILYGVALTTPAERVQKCKLTLVSAGNMCVGFQNRKLRDLTEGIVKPMKRHYVGCIRK